ncbi:MAG TPA: hypothetical protein VJS38_02695, partial [Phenylobacterium sp.]|uniref:hypothetical protein n=1 Tax=Phenylobacterium sp. TaxID=1871053 RepID=UPI002B466FB4
MILHLRPTHLIPLAGSAWVLSATLAQAGPAAGRADAQVPAVSPADPGKWSFSISPYLWMASVKTSGSFT